MARSKKRARKKKEIIVMVSGGFDPLHLGHLRHFKAARKLGDELVVAIDDDTYLIKKKGGPFMPLEDRAAIIRELRCVDRVIIHKNTAKLILRLRPSVYANGGDRNSPRALPHAEVEACRKVGCRMIFHVGGGKTRSSSQLLADWVQRVARQRGVHLTKIDSLVP